MARRDEKLKYLAEVPLFSGCSKKDIELVARHAEHVKFEAGKALITEGRVGYDFFLILDGKARVERGGKEVAKIGPGDFFGELSLLDRAPRNATVVAETELDTIVLGQREFSGLLDTVPTLAHKMLVGLARRIHEIDAKTIA
jgi:CRP-like cAMP-binding protein